MRLVVELGGQLVSRSAGAHGTCTSLGVGIAALDHKTRLHAMECGSVVEALLREFDEACHVIGGNLRIELELDDALGGRDDRDLVAGDLHIGYVHRFLLGGDCGGLGGLAG